MARPLNKVDTIPITIATTPGIAQYLDDLVTGGLYGKGRAEAAERLVARGIEALLRDGTLARRKMSNGRKRK